MSTKHVIRAQRRHTFLNNKFGADHSATIQAKEAYDAELLAYNNGQKTAERVDVLEAAAAASSALFG